MRKRHRKKKQRDARENETNISGIERSKEKGRDVREKNTKDRERGEKNTEGDTRGRKIYAKEREICLRKEEAKKMERDSCER
jgi:hypothetical protein